MKPIPPMNQPTKAGGIGAALVPDPFWWEMDALMKIPMTIYIKPKSEKKAVVAAEIMYPRESSLRCSSSTMAWRIGSSDKNQLLNACE